MPELQSRRCRGGDLAETNKLIESLPAQDRRRLLAACELVEIRMSEVLCAAGKPMRYAYFPSRGFISLVANTPGSSGVEVGMIGREGMLGAHLTLGVSPAPLNALIQGSGAAWRISAAQLKLQLAAGAALRRTTGRYLYVLMSQLANSAACLRFHPVGPRLARWLLMSRDRAGANEFPVTHEFLAYMLGVRRVGITSAANALRQAGVIEYRRGQLEVIDRGGLEGAACACYAFDRGVYARVMKAR